MASKRQLKKDLNNAFGELIEAALVWQQQNPEGDSDKAEAIIEDAIACFDELNAQVNQRKVEDVQAHYKTIHTNFETKARDLASRVNEL